MGNNTAIGGGGFHHVAIKVYDFEASKKFYTEVLGFREKLSWGEAEKRGVLLDTGDGNYLEMFAGGSKGRKPDEIAIHFALRSDDVDAAIERVRAAGAEITVEPKDVVLQGDPPTPIRVGFCKGPDGEVIEFFSSTGENLL